MSSRGLIARTKDGGYEGVYNHSDSQPIWLGQSLWSKLQAASDLSQFLKETVDEHPGGWSSYPSGCYCHGLDPDGPQMVVDEATINWLFTEWAYVIDPEGRSLSVVVGCVRRPGTHTVVNSRGEARKEENYGWQLLATFPLEGEEPNWKHLQKQGSRIRDEVREALAGASL